MPKKSKRVNKSRRRRTRKTKTKKNDCETDEAVEEAEHQ